MICGVGWQFAVGSQIVMSLLKKNPSFAGLFCNRALAIQGAHTSLPLPLPRLNPRQRWVVTHLLERSANCACIWMPPWNTRQHTATHCNTKQRTATHRNAMCSADCAYTCRPPCNSLQLTATHCNSMQHNATRCNTPQHAALCRLCLFSDASLQLSVNHWHSLQLTATHHNTPPHTATHCNTLRSADCDE